MYAARTSSDIADEDVRVPGTGTLACFFVLFCLCSSAGSVGTFLASQSSRLNNASFYYLPERALFLFIHAVLEEEPFPIFLFFYVKLLVFFFCTYAIMLLLSSRTIRYLLPYRTASTAQHSTAQSTRTSSEASTRRSERDKASKQT